MMTNGNDDGAYASPPEEQAQTQISDVQIQRMAQLCHEANRVYCVSIGDNSQVHWANAEGWQHESAISGVRGIIFNNASAEESHENWLRDKETDGWVYGEVKDPEAKTHPCFVPYDELPDEQKIKDHIFRAACLGYFHAFVR